jgi:hypothetical protein
VHGLNRLEEVQLDALGVWPGVQRSASTLRVSVEDGRVWQPALSSLRSSCRATCSPGAKRETGKPPLSRTLSSTIVGTRKTRSTKLESRTKSIDQCSQGDLGTGFGSRSTSARRLPFSRRVQPFCAVLPVSLLLVYRGALVLMLDLESSVPEPRSCAARIQRLSMSSGGLKTGSLSE